MECQFPQLKTDRVIHTVDGNGAAFISVRQSTANTVLAPVVFTPGGSDVGVLDVYVAAPGIVSAADGSRPSVGRSNDGGTLDINISAVGFNPISRTRADGCCILAACGSDIAAHDGDVAT